MLNMITVIFVIPMWWIFLWVNICLRLQIFCFSYEYRCILCTPFLFTCYDQAYLWERVWGDVCISWSNEGWLVQWTWEKVLRSTWVSLPYFVASLRIKRNTMLPEMWVWPLPHPPWLDLACSYFNFMSWYLLLYSELSKLLRCYDLVRILVEYKRD